MLYRAIAKEELWANGANTGKQRVSNQFFHPIPPQDLGIVIEKNQDRTKRDIGCIVVEAGIVERTIIAHEPYQTG